MPSCNEEGVTVGLEMTASLMTCTVCGQGAWVGVSCDCVFPGDGQNTLYRQELFSHTTELHTSPTVSLTDKQGMFSRHSTFPQREWYLLYSDQVWVELYIHS